MEKKTKKRIIKIVATVVTVGAIGSLGFLAYKRCPKVNTAVDNTLKKLHLKKESVPVAPKFETKPVRVNVNGKIKTK